MKIKRPSPVQAVFNAIARAFVKGLLAILPLGATIFVFVWLANTFESIFNTPIRGLMRLIKLDPDQYYIWGMGILVGLIFITALGILLNALLFRQLLELSEQLLERLPLARTVINGVRDLMGFFGKKEKEASSQVVLFALGQTNIKCMGFIMRSDLSDMEEAVRGDGRVAVYVPMSYGIGGYTVLIPRAHLEPIDLPMEEAMRYALTAWVKSEPKGESATQPLPPVAP